MKHARDLIVVKGTEHTSVERLLKHEALDKMRDAKTPQPEPQPAHSDRQKSVNRRIPRSRQRHLVCARRRTLGTPCKQDKEAQFERTLISAVAQASHSTDVLNETSAVQGDFASICQSQNGEEPRRYRQRFCKRHRDHHFLLV